MDAHAQQIHQTEYSQYMFEQLQRISSGISARDLIQIGFFHGMDKRIIMRFFQTNLDFISTLSIDEIARFSKIVLFILIEQYILMQSTRNAMRAQTFRILHTAMNLNSPNEDEENKDFYDNIKVPCFDVVCSLYSKISAQMGPKTQEDYRQVKQAFIDMVKSLVPDIHYLLNEKYPAGCDERDFFFGRKPDRFETLVLFQKFFFEITSNEFESVSFSQANQKHILAVQNFFEKIYKTL
jgi:hypothetical protein